MGTWGPFPSIPPILKMPCSEQPHGFRVFYEERIYIYIIVKRCATLLSGLVVLTWDKEMVDAMNKLVNNSTFTRDSISFCPLPRSSNKAVVKNTSTIAGELWKCAMFLLAQISAGNSKTRS